MNWRKNIWSTNRTINRYIVAIKIRSNDFFVPLDTNIVTENLSLNDFNISEILSHLNTLLELYDPSVSRKCFTFYQSKLNRSIQPKDKVPLIAFSVGMFEKGTVKFKGLCHYTLIFVNTPDFKGSSVLSRRECRTVWQPNVNACFEHVIMTIRGGFCTKSGNLKSLYIFDVQDTTFTSNKLNGKYRSKQKYFTIRSILIVSYLYFWLYLSVCYTIFQNQRHFRSIMIYQYAYTQTEVVLAPIILVRDEKSKYCV
ncbi:hypothetical protein F4703DRAFT_1918882 [Phycomyces blakesleeanus]